MNKQLLQRYFKNRIKQLAIQGDLSPTDQAVMVDDAIGLGLDDFWHAKKWRFRHAERILTITSEEDGYALPKDVTAVSNVREQASLDGGSMLFMAKDEFDAKIPSPSARPSGYPHMWTLYMDGDILWVKFFPRPTVDAIYYDALLDTPANMVTIPNIASAALIATIGKYLYKLGTWEYRESISVAESEIAKLEVEQNVFAGEQFKMLDSTDRQTSGRIPWFHSGDCR